MPQGLFCFVYSALRMGVDDFFLKYRQRCVPQKRLVMKKVYSVFVTSALALLHVRVNFFNQTTSIIQGFNSAPF